MYSEIESTIPTSIKWSAKSCIVHLTRPDGGSEQAVAIKNASDFPSKLPWQTIS
ncbi:hypothetical protein [Nostoc sp.]|uniref:hypothetical protein n=1 Tax=Nostoc sp. TaxID=1180 RepID=UPI003FA5731B|nr:hypothetical protein [Nostoc sp. NMS9]